MRDPVTGRFPRGSGIPARGGGRGYGGPARGTTRAAFTPERQPDPEAIKRGIAMSKRLKELLGGHLDAVAKTWVEIMNDPRQPAQARISAAEKIAERVEGKVTDKLEVSPLAEFSDDELRAAIAHARALAAHAEGDGAGTGEAGSAEPSGDVSPVH